MGAFVDSPHAANRPPIPAPSARVVLRSPLSPLGRAHATAWLMRFEFRPPSADGGAGADAVAVAGASSNGNLWRDEDTYHVVIPECNVKYECHTFVRGKRVLLTRVN